MVALICLALSFFLKNDLYIKIAVGTLIINTIVPTFFKYPAFFLLESSHLVGTIVSRILLTFIFFIIVVPIGFSRRMFGFDSLRLRKFKKGNESVMITRNITFKSKDLERPF